ncbi:hypothetical protein [Streptomyces sp. TLI_105]|uniref:hypothetical protein n=1 Tax=Streptomyces sp. TLI_105 TaxID=1881019 RepID=UPI0008973EBF|nr:hypothetical protein [Streptomyces sp. TLI_105]SEC31462.1 hypothetical protein SAMN05428939_2061 [Streptomyces sp. TLI_105]
MSEPMHHSGVADALDEIFRALGPRELVLCRERIFSARPASLARLGQAIGVSRERTGQIDHQVRKNLKIAFFASVPVAEAARWIVDNVPCVAEVSRLATQRPEMSALVESVGVPVIGALAAVGTKFEVWEGWVLAPDADDAVRSTADVLDAHASPEGVVPLGVVAHELSMPQEEAARWLTRCGHTMIDDHVLIRTSTLEDHVAGVLGVAGEPRTLDAIHGQLQPKRTSAAVRNALVADERFMKSDRTEWALTRWGLPEYMPIRQQIAHLVTESGGQIELDKLIDSIRSRYDVSEASIRTYASAGEFRQTNNVVSFRSAVRKPGRSPQGTPRLYREGEILRFRMTINNQHKRGSSFSLPSGLAGLLGVGPNSSKSLASRLGPQEIVWSSVQARTGTIKRFLQDVGAQVGDIVFLTFRPGDEFDVEPLRKSGTGLRAALAMTGHSHADDPTLTDTDLLAALAHAVWLEKDVSLEEVRATLDRRREPEIVDALASAAERPPQVS